MIGKLVDQHLGQQTRCGDTFVDDVRLDRHLHQGLAAGAGPFAAHMAVHAKDTRHIVQLLGHVLTNALHLAAAACGGAHGGLGLVAKRLTRQLSGQGLALGRSFFLSGSRFGLCQCNLIGHGSQVGVQRFIEQAALLGVHLLALEAELQALENGVLVGEFVDQRLLELDLRGVAGHLLQQARDHLAQLICVQICECGRCAVHGLEVCPTLPVLCIRGCPN